MTSKKMAKVHPGFKSAAGAGRVSSSTSNVSSTPSTKAEADAAIKRAFASVSVGAAARPKVYRGGPKDGQLFRGEQPSLWQPFRDGVTQSFLRKFRDCREHCRLSYVEGLTSPRQSDAQLFGNAAHWALSKLPVPGKAGKRRMPTATEVSAAVADYERAFLAEVRKPSQYQLEQLEAQLGQVDPVLARYVERWQGDWTGKYPEGGGVAAPEEWLGAEEAFCVPLRLDDGREVPIRGKMDGLFLGAKGREWVRENKFKGRIDEDGIADLLAFDLQVWTYLWAARAVRGRCPAGVVYCVTRRPQLRRGNEGLHEFLDRVEKDVRSRKRASHYFHRMQVAVTEREVLDWEARVLRPMVEDVVAWFEGRAPHYLNDDALIGKYGRSEWYELIVRGDRSGASRREHAFSELMGDL